MADLDQKPSQGKWIALSLVLLVVGFGGGYLASRGSLQPGVTPAVAPPEPPAPPAPAVASSAPASPAPAPSQPDAVTKQGDEVVISEEYKNRLLTVDFAQLLHDANVRRYYHEGKLRGVKIDRIHAGSIYDKVGLQNDDIIEAINGIAIADPADAAADAKAMLSKLPRVGAVELKVERYHETVILKLRIAGGGMMAGKLKGIASGWLERSVKSAVMGGGVATELAKKQLRRTFASAIEKNAIDDASMEKVAALITAGTGQLKGLAMKCGQMLSYMDSTLPEPARKVLATLQDSTPPMAPAAVRQVIREELGKDVDELFAEWDDTPLAAASIGQVHRAVAKDGRRLAVKVQYPEIQAAFASDFKNLGMLGKLLDMLIPGGASHVIEELRERLSEECDYRQELANLERFRSVFGATPGVRLPLAYPEFCAKRVLTTEFIDGQRFADFVATASQEARNQAGRTIYELVYTAIWRHRFFNGDPHPGNYLFTPDAVVFLDFGCVKYWDKKFLDGQLRLIHATLSCDVSRFRQAVIDEGIVIRPDGFDFHRYLRASLCLAHPYVFDADFPFTNRYVTKMNEVLKATVSPMSESMPKDLTLANRVWWGLYSVLAAMGATFNAHAIVKPLIYDDPADFPVVPRRMVPTAEDLASAS